MAWAGLVLAWVDSVSAGRPRPKCRQTCLNRQDSCAEDFAGVAAIKVSATFAPTPPSSCLSQRGLQMILASSTERAEAELAAVQVVARVEAVRIQRRRKIVGSAQ